MLKHPISKLTQNPCVTSVTNSYFSCWAYFDLCFGKQSETLADIALAVAKEQKVHPVIFSCMMAMNQSRMSFYLHKGCVDGVIELEELITEKQFFVEPSTKYLGEAGEVWFVRLFAPCPEYDENISLIFTMPYILGTLEFNEKNEKMSFQGQQEFALRFLLRSFKSSRDKVRGYEQFMKYGRNLSYWNEYVFQGFAESTSEYIVLLGYPDIPISLPQSWETQSDKEAFWDFHAKQGRESFGLYQN